MDDIGLDFPPDTDYSFFRRHSTTTIGKKFGAIIMISLYSNSTSHQ